MPASLHCSWENTSGFGDRGKSPGGRATRKSPEQSRANQQAVNWKGRERNKRSSFESRINIYSFINRCTYCCPEGTYHRCGTRGQEASTDAEGARRHHREAALGSLSEHTETRGGSPWLEKGRCYFIPKQGEPQLSLWEDRGSSKLHGPGNGICERQEGNWDHLTMYKLCLMFISCWDEITGSMGKGKARMSFTLISSALPKQPGEKEVKEGSNSCP